MLSVTESLTPLLSRTNHSTIAIDSYYTHWLCSTYVCADKDHMFRMEECFSSSKSHSATKAKHPATMAAGTRIPVSPQTTTSPSSPPPSLVASPEHSQQVGVVQFRYSWEKGFRIV